MLTWARRGGRDGAEFTSGPFLVRKVSWTPPGFKKRKNWGWALFHCADMNAPVRHYERTGGPAYDRAVDAQASAEHYHS